ncbi:S41 family peptidase [Chitinophaga sancti]|uniref:Peptidase family S41 n=1 Tax=Chitinophaga sancti TaxID=1004 RepID=A0A1K1MX57_9BACT|nr:S41 family peptidase [Chitinophaga sancti]WQD63067.1 S41 family peptidase [Chitinophaga sancti]WQG91308.1 S41 family peptidase [Chitinophaga sancti]SFW27699.1 Peptidase family S41 [Chitinophaga sancti]
MRYLSLLFLFITVHAFAQDCNCSTQFKFVKKYYEENNPAFQQIKADRKLLNAYNDSVRFISNQLSKMQGNDLCNIYFSRYVNLLKDHHSGIALQLQRVVSFSSQAVIDSFKQSAAYRAFEIKAIDTTQVLEHLKSKSRDAIEGIYTLGNNIRVGILENGKDHYEAIVLKKTNLLELGHILLTLDRIGENAYSCFYNMGLLGFNFNQVYTDQIHLVDGNLPQLGYFKAGSAAVTNQWEFKILDSSTCYLAIRSFLGELQPQLDSLYKAVIPEIQKRKYLVLDVRDNGGGAERNYFDLLQLMYTKPLELDQLSVWVSPDNIKALETQQTPDTRLIAAMKKVPLYTFLSLNKGKQETWTMQASDYPEKVALIYNHGTASAAEGLIVYALQSSKVVTMGAHSGGYMGYGDVTTVDIPCGKFVLRTTTTKWKNKSKYEFIGIPPMVVLEEGTDWVKKAGEVLSRKH